MSSINSSKFKDMLMYGSAVLNANKEEINLLNVFPVPDGDTGYNMNMTINEGVNSLKVCNETEVGLVARAFSKGLLRGARGNSGVILSQFFRGLSEGLEGEVELNSKNLQKAFKQATIRAYDSVIKAVEGTILTVSREMSENAEYNDDLTLYLKNVYEAGKVSLKNTPNLLPILKEANVVDSGGAGFLYVIKGMLYNLMGEELDLNSEETEEQYIDHHEIDPDKIEFKYCTEMLVKLSGEFDIKVVKSDLENYGDSIVAIMDEDILKVHVHTNEPTDVFNYGLKMGEFIHVKSENMVIQAIEAQELSKSKKKEVGIVCVSSSEQMSELFKNFQDVEIIQGGQSLNPSVDDIVKAIEKANCKKCIVLPNNSNIIMAAQAASEIVSCEVEVIKTKHLTQAVELLSMYVEQADFDSSVNTMNEILEEMTNYEITNAIKDTVIDGVEIKDGDFLCLKNGKISKSESSIRNILFEIVDELIENDNDVVTFLLGENSDMDLVQEVSDYIEEKSPFMEIHIHETLQPVYSYLISGV